METRAHILVVDDDDRLRRLLERYLSEQGFSVATAADTGQATQAAEEKLPDIIVLDVMMPGETGLVFVQRLRTEGQNIPVLLLSALGETDHRIEGLESGADDYLSKPFEPRELLLRIETILRRIGGGNRPETKQVRFGGFVFDLEQEKLFAEGEAIYLTSIETSLLSRLAQTPNEPVSREELAKENFTGSERSVDVQITRLRKKIEQDPKQPLFLQTVRHRGYVLKAEGG